MSDERVKKVKAVLDILTGERPVPHSTSSFMANKISFVHNVVSTFDDFSQE